MMRRSVTKSKRAEAQPVEQSVVTELRPLASDPNMRQVRVGRRCVATLRAADVESLGIVPGTAWTEQLCQRVQEAAALNRARRQAMTLLGRRQLSRGELIDRLTRKNHPPAMAQRIADELAAGTPAAGHDAQPAQGSCAAANRWYAFPPRLRR